MYIDKNLQMCTNQAVTADAATTNIINQGAAGDAYDGKWMFIHCSENAATCDGIIFKLQTSVDEAFTSPIDVLVAPQVLVASLLADTIVWKARIPSGLKQYIRGYFDVQGSNATAGKYTWNFGVPDMHTT